MTKSNKIILAVAIVAIVGLLAYVGISGASLTTVPCSDCGAAGVIEEVACETCGGEGAVRASLWALLPPVIAIGLALITKEVYSSLFIGILSGALLSSDFSFTGTMDDLIGVGLQDAVNARAHLLNNIQVPKDAHQLFILWHRIAHKELILRKACWDGADGGDF